MISASPPIGRKSSALQLNPGLRYSLLIVALLLFGTGIAWLIADQYKTGPESEFWQSAAATLLALHGGASMLSLILLGALFPLHIRRSWRSGRNRLTGLAMITVCCLLITSAFALYYSGSDTLRGWASWIHTVGGAAIPAIILAHILIGRQSRQASLPGSSIKPPSR